MLLKLSNNRIMYRNISGNPARYAAFINRELQKYYNFRVRELTHAQVADMQRQADGIVRRRLSYSGGDAVRSEFQKGKRADHDSLPREIQALYEEVPQLTARLRFVHTKLLTLSLDNATCPDSERYPFLKELIELDKHIKSNWERYDTFTSGETGAAVADDARERSRRAIGAINLFKARYRAHPSPELAGKLAGWYGQVLNPTEKLTEELTKLGILK